jgi:hypothetical protein
MTSPKANSANDQYEDRSHIKLADEKVEHFYVSIPTVQQIPFIPGSVSV